MKRTKLSSAAFLEAARLIGEGENAYACNALWYATGHTYEEACNAPDWCALRDAIPEVCYFTAMLKPSGGCDAWYRTLVEGCPNPDNHTARILGLILCSILVEEGFEP